MILFSCHSSPYGLCWITVGSVHKEISHQGSSRKRLELTFIYIYTKKKNFGEGVGGGFALFLAQLLFLSHRPNYDICSIAQTRGCFLSAFSAEFFVQSVNVSAFVFNVQIWDFYSAFGMWESEWKQDGNEVIPVRVGFGFQSIFYSIFPF